MYDVEKWRRDKDKDDLNAAITGILACIYILLFFAVVLGYVKVKNIKEHNFQTNQTNQRKVNYGR